MRFSRANQFRISLSEYDWKQLSSKEQIARALTDSSVLSYDIWDGDTLIGFAMLCPFNEHGYFLWNFAIDKAYQSQNYGQRALRELLNMLKKERDARVVTTTYTYGNNRAKHVYEKVGFRETDVVDENGIHEVNMVIEL